MIVTGRSKCLMLSLLLIMLVSCQTAIVKPLAHDLVFCAEQAVYSVPIESNSEGRISKILDLPEDATCPVWSPDGMLAVLYRYRQNKLIVEDSLSLIDRQTGSIREVYHFGPRDAEWTIQWIPNGISLLVASARDYQKVNPCAIFTERTFNGIDCWSSVADLYRTNVFLQSGLDQFERLTTSPSARCSFSWSSDGHKLAFARGSVCSEGGIDDGNIDVIDLRTHNVINSTDSMSNTTILSSTKIYSSPKWSPNGDQLLFSSLQFGATTPTQQMLIANGSDMRLAPPDDGRPAYWSPDGKKIIWTRDTLGITDVASDHFSEWPISKDTQFRISQYSWSPDSQYFVWTEWNNLSGKKELRISDPASNKIATLAPMLAHDWSWSPDSKWLAFSVWTPIEPTACKYQIDIYIVKPDGTDLQNTTKGQQLNALHCGPQGFGWEWYQEMVNDVQWLSK